jgi:hypothetical protein
MTDECHPDAKIDDLTGYVIHLAGEIERRQKLMNDLREHLSRSAQVARAHAHTQTHASLPPLHTLITHEHGHSIRHCRPLIYKKIRPRAGGLG